MILEDVMKRVQGIIEAEIGIVFEYNAILLEEGVGSMMLIAIVVKIEDEFDIEFEADSLSYNVLKTIETISQEILKIVERLWDI